MHTLHFYPHCSVLLNGGCHECVWRLTRMLCHLPTQTCVCGRQAISQFLQKKTGFPDFCNTCIRVYALGVPDHVQMQQPHAERPVHPKFSDVPTHSCALAAHISTKHNNLCAQSRRPDLSQHTCVCVCALTSPAHNFGELVYLLTVHDHETN